VAKGGELPIKTKSGELQISHDFLAGRHYVLASIQSGDSAVALQQVTEQMLSGEGEVTFAAAEIDNIESAVCGQCIDDIVNEFQKAVDLAELSGVAVANSAIGCHDARVNQEWTGLSGWDQIITTSIMLWHGSG